LHRRNSREETGDVRSAALRRLAAALDAVAAGATGLGGRAAAAEASLLSSLGGVSSAAAAVRA